MTDDKPLLVSWLPSAGPEIAQLEDGDTIVSFQGLHIVDCSYQYQVRPVPQTFQRKRAEVIVRHGYISCAKRTHVVTYSFGLPNKEFVYTNPYYLYNTQHRPDYAELRAHPEQCFDHEAYYVNGVLNTMHLNPFVIKD